MLDIEIASFDQLCVSVSRFCLEFVDLRDADRQQFKGAFVGVKPAPLFQRVFKVQTKA